MNSYWFILIRIDYICPILYFRINYFLSKFLESAADILADNPNGTITLLVNGVSAFCINGKPVVVNGLRKMRIGIFAVVPFNRIL